MLKPQSFVQPIKNNRNYNLTPEIILWRAVIVRTILDALDIDIHAWGFSRRVIVSDAKKWFVENNEDFELTCDYANLKSWFVVKLYNRIKVRNAKKLFENKNLNKFLLEYLCTFTEEE